ncbi:MAG: FHA domain-containing protein [Rhodoferax sp.]|nr:FHA domain-containing protein [Rhodoferax sp.]
MPKITIRLDGELISEASLDKKRTTVGRRPFNDVVLNELAVSGRHACLIHQDQQVTIEDLDSTNGTYVNGRAVQKQLLQDSDTIEIGSFKLVFSSGSEVPVKALDSQQPPPYDANGSQAFNDLAEPPASLQGRIKVVSGSAAGRELPLTKAVTTFGKPGVSVAAITRRDANYYVQHVEGAQAPLLNGVATAQEPVLLHQGDEITLSGTVLQFLSS